MTHYPYHEDVDGYGDATLWYTPTPGSVPQMVLRCRDLTPGNHRLLHWRLLVDAITATQADYMAEARDLAAEEHVSLLPRDEQERALGRGVWSRS